MSGADSELQEQLHTKSMYLTSPFIFEQGNNKINHLVKKSVRKSIIYLILMYLAEANARTLLAIMVFNVT